MARLVAAFGTSHSPMLASSVEEWQTVFLARDKARQFVDFDGNACDYDTLLARAPADAVTRIAPEQLARRHDEAMRAMARLRDDVAAESVIRRCLLDVRFAPDCGLKSDIEQIGAY